MKPLFLWIYPPGIIFFNIGNSMFANEGLVEVVVYDLGKGDENGGTSIF